MSTSPTKPAQVHNNNLELSVYSCWTGKRLLRAKITDMKIDPRGKWVSVDIDDDEPANPEFVFKAATPVEENAL